MAISRRQHVVIALGLVERMTDEDIIHCFKASDDGSEVTPQDAREYVAELRAQGYNYFPCACETHKPDGSCPGLAL